MRFIHIADVHLGVKPDRGRPWSDDRALEIQQSFTDIINLCEEEKIELLLIAGDLFHTPPTISQLRELDYKLRRLSVTKTVIIAGNHDYIEDGSTWDNFTFESDAVVLPRDRATNAYIKELNVCITGYSYGRPEYTERILERLKPARPEAYNILLGHGGDKTHMPFSKERLAKLGFNYVALGHIHKPQHILKNRMAFSGSLEPIDYTETGRRGYILGEVLEDGNTNITWIPFNKRSYVNMTIDVSTTGSNTEIAELIEEQIKQLGAENIYRILLKGRVDCNLDINVNFLAKKYCINEIINRTEPDYDVNELVTVNENNLLGRFIKTLADDDQRDEELRYKAMRYGIDALLGIGDK